MPRDAKDVAAGLEKKGFVARSGDHTFYQLYVDNKKTIVVTKISHGEKEIGDPLLAVMSRQVKLNRRQFLELVDCPLSHDEYVKILRASGAVEKPEK